jgi:hypothetical protein
MNDSMFKNFEINDPYRHCPGNSREPQALYNQTIAKNQKWITRIKRVMTICVLVFLWPSALPAQENQDAEQIVFMNLNDIPVMQGMEELPDHTLIFDKPGGRIIESAMVAQNLDRETIESFYDRTLPQLGWIRTDRQTYIRRNEKLSMTIEEEDNYRILFLRVEPH